MITVIRGPNSGADIKTRGNIFVLFYLMYPDSIHAMIIFVCRFHLLPIWTVC